MKTTRVWRFAGASAGACALGLLLALFVPGAGRAAALWGVAAATLGAAAAFVALAVFIGKGINGLLTGFTVGFLARTVLVTVGLLLSGARGNLALVYVAAFFTLYAATQVVEVLFVQASSQRATT